MVKTRKKIKHKIHHHKKQSGLVKKFKSFRVHHRIAFYIVGALGVIFVWRGIWTIIDATPFFSDPLASLGIGIGLAFAGGMFFELA
jgi:hypothetical protein